MKAAAKEDSMKLIPLRKTDTGGTADVIREALGVAPQGAKHAEWGQRFKVIHAVNANADPEKLLLEDADYALVTRAIDALDFTRMSEETYDWIAEIKGAQAPPPVDQPAA